MISQTAGVSHADTQQEGFTRYRYRKTYTTKSPRQSFAWYCNIYVLGNKENFQKIIDYWNNSPLTQFHYEAI